MLKMLMSGRLNDGVPQQLQYVRVRLKENWKLKFIYYFLFS